MNWVYRFFAALALFGWIAVTARGDEQRTNRVLENPVQDGDIKFRVNDGGIKTDTLTIDGPTANIGMWTDAPASTPGFSRILHLFSGSDVSLRLQGSGGSWEIGNNTGNALQFYSGSNLRATISSAGSFETNVRTDGNCGIGNICSGTNSPAITNGTNVSSSANADCQWMRVGNTVTVSCIYDMNTTSGAGTASDFGIDLPIASNFTTIRQLGGTFTSGTQGSPTSGEIVICYSDISNDRATCNFKAYSTTNRTWAGSFTYKIQ